MIQNIMEDVCRIRVCDDVKRMLDERKKNLSYTQLIEQLLGKEGYARRT
jgi:hypothetical protein